MDGMIIPKHTTSALARGEGWEWWILLLVILVESLCFGFCNFKSVMSKNDFVLEHKRRACERLDESIRQLRGKLGRRVETATMTR